MLRHLRNAERYPLDLDLSVMLTNLIIAERYGWTLEDVQRLTWLQRTQVVSIMNAQNQSKALDLAKAKHLAKTKRKR